MVGKLCKIIRESGRSVVTLNPQMKITGLYGHPERGGTIPFEATDEALRTPVNVLHARVLSSGSAD